MIAVKVNAPQQAGQPTPARVISQNTLIDTLRERHRFVLEKVALIEETRQVTYGAYWERIEFFSSALLDKGVQPGHVIGIMCPLSSIDVASLVLAIMDVGAVPMVINLTDKFQRVEPEEIGVFGFVMHERTQKLFRAKNPPKKVDRVDKGLNWYQVNLTGDARKIAAAALVTSSGSTGGKKIIQYTQRGILENVRRNVKAIGINPADRTLMVLPLTYSYGLVAQFLSHLYMGATIIFSNKVLFVGAILRLINQHQINSVFTVPPIFRQMVYMINKQEKFKDQPELWKSLRYVTCGGNHIEPDTVRKALKTFNCPIVKTYGLAEAGPRVATNIIRATTDAIDSVGFPLDDVEVMIINPRGDKLPPRKVGRIVVRTPSAAAGYFLGKSNGLKIVGKTIYTQDLGYINDEGQIFILGRKSSKIRLKRFGPVLWQNQLMDEVYGNFSVFKLSVSKESSGRIKVGVVPMAKEKPTADDILNHIERRFGRVVRNQTDVFFPRLNRLKFQK
ncbi:MAG: acyl-CoA synthetase (AMP-forming)/AMP-acid ligase II [Neolewinella sp.]|jgi:acyl-CoA synthetase (AMP-forming)/AMP-acid ligase II